MAPEYWRVVARRRLIRLGALSVVMVIVAVVARNPGITGGVLVGGLPIMLTSILLQVWSGRRARNGAWHYEIDDRGIVLRPPLGSFLIARYLLMWPHASGGSASLSHWNELPAMRILSRRGTEWLLVYERSDADRVYREVLPRVQGLLCPV